MVRQLQDIGCEEQSGQEVRVNIGHIRASKFCMRGARAWFEHYGISWSDFLKDGIAAEQLEATGDALAYRVTSLAREERSNG